MFGPIICNVYVVQTIINVTMCITKSVETSLCICHLYLYICHPSVVVMLVSHCVDIDWRFASTIKNRILKCYCW